LLNPTSHLKYENSSRCATAPRRIKIVHIINGLGIGGAELALFRLLVNADRSKFDMRVVALLNEYPLGDRLRDIGFSVSCLHLAKGKINALRVMRMIRLLRKERPQIVQTWLQQSDLLGGAAAKIAGIGPVLWNIRHSTLHPSLTNRRTHVIARVCAKLSRHLPARIVCCSESSRYEQIKLGYCAGKMVVIPNGVDTATFKPDAEAYESVRRELGIAPSALLFGAAGRRHPAKDHATLIRAAGEIAAKCHGSHFLFCGDEVTTENPELRAHVAATGYPDRFHLLGHRNDVPRLMAAFDVFISASCFSEGFPNVVSEAMACGVPCIVTDVGDSARILGNTGRVVLPEQPSALAAAAIEFAQAGKDSLRMRGLEARARILDNFGLSTMVSRYQDLYMETVGEYS
jgi:glycosyltransferase involved in cell wall biosynthesis